jgi:hypothetical protein
LEITLALLMASSIPRVASIATAATPTAPATIPKTSAILIVKFERTLRGNRRSIARLRQPAACKRKGCVHAASGYWRTNGAVGAPNPKELIDIRVIVLETRKLAVIIYRVPVRPHPFLARTHPLRVMAIERQTVNLLLGIIHYF